jgi:hypothetical protein
VIAKLVVLGAGPRLGRDLEGLAEWPRKFAVEKDALRKVPSRPLTPPPKVNWLRFCSSTLNGDVELVLPELAGCYLGRPLHGLK